MLVVDYGVVGDGYCVRSVRVCGGHLFWFGCNRRGCVQGRLNRVDVGGVVNWCFYYIF